MFIHDAILEAVTCGDTQIDSGNLRAKLNKLLRKDRSGKTELELQFAVSHNQVFSTSWTHSTAELYGVEWAIIDIELGCLMTVICSFLLLT